MEMRALKTFSSGGVFKVNQGDTFTTTKQKAQEYMRLKLAEPVEGEIPQEIKAQTEPIEPDQAAPTTYTEDELKEKTLTDLRRIAKEMGIVGYSGMNKSEVINAILQKQQ